MRRQEAIAEILRGLSDEPVICCNGLISREAFHRLDRDRNFYMIGSMGLAASIGLGLARARMDLKVVVLDGDGNVLMNLGTLAEVGVWRPTNLVHICLDNGVYASTGDQPTLAQWMDLSQVARASGYAQVAQVSDLESLRSRLREGLEEDGPVFLHVKIGPDRGSQPPGRVSLDPEAIRERFMEALGRMP